MNILYSDLEDEVRDGFYVNSLMKCCWMSQLQVLEEIDKVCRKHNIQYQAEWGTLLGTVRHGGFIPWDDDMDISMKRQDYNKFMKVAKEELPEGYHISNYKNDEEYWDVMARVVNLKAISLNHKFLKKNANCPFAVGVDIFPLDYLPVDEEEAEVLKDLLADLKNTADTYSAGILQGEELEERLQMMEYVCNQKIKREGNLRENLYDLMVSLYSIYQEDEAEEIGIVPLWAKSGRHHYPKEYYSSTARMPFDRITIPVPIAYDSILKHKYRNYMKMVRKGGTHDYPYYNRQIEVLKEKGFPWPCYQFSDRVCRENKDETERKANLGTEKLGILEEAHSGLYKLLLIGELETAIQVLVNCQECAIALGEPIGETVAGCETLISSLEEYCELVYQIYQIILDGEKPDAQGVFLILQEQFAKIKEEFSKEYELKKKVVFVTDKASRWKSLESIWKAAKEDEDCIVSVIVVPYVYKRVDGSILEERYEKDLFPEYVEIEDYKTFNLKNYYPDVIYINSPYDEYNYLTNIHPAFYSSKLVNMCEKLVYIPWFVMTELEREDERGWQSMQHFVTVPGVVNADKVIVQSEKMKENYVDYLTDWAGEETRNMWEEKICGLGSPLLDPEDEEDELLKKIPETWKPYLFKENGDRKKVILYHVPVSSIIDYKDKVISKLQRVMDIFKENKEEICVLWYWEVSMEDTLRLNYPDLWNEVQKIVKQFKEESCGILEEKQDKELMVALSNGYYGDVCAISQAMVIAEKPVMLQNYDC